MALNRACVELYVVIGEDISYNAVITSEPMRYSAIYIMLGIVEVILLTLLGFFFYDQM